MSDPDGMGEELMSLAAAALVEAEADAAKTDQLIFDSDEWRHIPRTRNSGAQGRSPFRKLRIIDRLVELIPKYLRDRSSTPTTSPASAAPRPRPSAAAGHGFPKPASEPQSHPEVQVDGAVAELIKANKVVYNALINHPFPKSFGDGSASLDGFRYYMIQDAKYLVTCARVKMESVAEAGNADDIDGFLKRHESSLGYVKEIKEILTSMLGVPESIIKATQRSEKVNASEQHYMKSLRNEKSFLAYYVILLPCILSYWKISQRLMESPSALKNVIYRKAWAKIHYDPSSAIKYIKFINANIMKNGGVDRWSDVFKKSCRLEADIFNTGLQYPTPYETIINGIYFIHSSSGEGVVLTNLNVESFLRSPSGKCLSPYFPSDAGSSVVGVEKTGRNNEKWYVVVTNDGYTFKNMETGHYLGIATELARKEGRILQATAKPYYWWINPVSKGSSLYQIYESRNLRYTLHAHIEVLKSVGSTNLNYTPIVAFENCEDSCQVWSFEPVQLDVRDPQKDVVNMDPKEVAQKMAELIKIYERILWKEFEKFEKLREEGSKKIMELLVEASKDATEVAELFEKYERVLGGEFEAIERQRREHNKKKRRGLLEEVRKFTDSYGTRKMAELFEKYERMLQQEFDNIEKLRKERNDEIGQKRLARGETMPEMVKIYEGILQENVKACGLLRRLHHEDVRQELLEEIVMIEGEIHE